MEVFGFFTKVGNALYLSVLWLICCIPIVTIGASTTAFCYVMNKLIWNQEGYITRSFFKALKENFKSSTKVWLILFALILIFTNNFAYMWKMAHEASTYVYFLPIYGMLVLLLWATLIYVFPYMARFENTTLNTIKNSFLMSTRHLGVTIVIMVLNFLILFIGLFVFLLVILVAPALICFINVGMLNFIFRKYEA